MGEYVGYSLGYAGFFEYHLDAASTSGGVLKKCVFSEMGQKRVFGP